MAQKYKANAKKLNKKRSKTEATAKQRKTETCKRKTEQKQEAR
jgi:hypothetical protein